MGFTPSSIIHPPMSAQNPSSYLRFYRWLLLILLAAVFLRLYNLSSIPPGLTHDEADHGLTAWSIVHEGVRDIYFTVGYGREPLYDYVTASLMTFLGSTYFAGRVTAAYFSVLLIAAMTAWVRRAFDNSTALLTAAGLAVGFWPVMAGRQALRSTLLPALFALAVVLFWLGLDHLQGCETRLSTARVHPILKFAAAGILLGLTIYTYIPARWLWIIFPLFLLYLFLVSKSLFRKAIGPTILMLLIMLVIAAPLLIFLTANPAAEVRIQQLAAPLFAARTGDWALLLQNTSQALRLFFLEGDPAWRYNIAGKPLLGPAMAVLFLAGLFIVMWHIFTHRAKEQSSWEWHYGPASLLAISWLGAGLLPALITGSDLSMTQTIGMQPVIYLFPAMALSAAGRIKIAGQPLTDRRWVVIGLVLFFAGSAVLTYRDYFITWANNPEVRVQYESTLSTAIDYLNEHGQGQAAISTITPSRYHSPAVAQMRLRNDAVDLRWFDARSSLLLPGMGQGTIFIPGFTSLAPPLKPFFSTAELQTTLPLPDTDLDRPLTVYTVEGAKILADWQGRLEPVEAQFSDVVTLLGYHLESSTIKSGEKMQLVTYWQAERPLENAMIFVHILGADGVPLTQQDLLGVPGSTWQAGTNYLQVHEIPIPTTMPPGQYPIVVGVYDQVDGKRLTLSGSNQGENLFHLTDLTISS